MTRKQAKKLLKDIEEIATQLQLEALERGETLERREAEQQTYELIAKEHNIDKEQVIAQVAEALTMIF